MNFHERPLHARHCVGRCDYRDQSNIDSTIKESVRSNIKMYITTRESRTKACVMKVKSIVL